MEEKILLLRSFLDKHNLQIFGCGGECPNIAELDQNTGEELWTVFEFEHYPGNCEDPSQLERHQQDG